MHRAILEKVLWHGSDRDDLRLACIEPCFHLGTRQQAEMRWPDRHLYQAVVRVDARTSRRRDQGAWNKRALIACRNQTDIIIYLNRYEGIPLDQIGAAAANDNVADARFRRLVPAAAESVIVINPDVISSFVQVR